MNRRKAKTRKFILVLIIVFSIFTYLGRNTEFNNNRFFTFFSNVEYVVIKQPINIVGDFIDQITSFSSVYDENEQLKAELNQYETNENNLAALENEIASLKEQLGLDILPSEYSLLTASVIQRDQSTWSSEITISLNQLEDVEKGMAVVDDKGLIGIITSVNSNSAKVQLLTTSTLNNMIPVVLINDGEKLYGLIEGYDENSEKLKVVMLSKIESLQGEVKVYTSGLGDDDNAPKNIYVGTAVDLSFKEDGTTAVALVEGEGSFDDLDYVSVVQTLNNE